jgi:hypothetical protein
MLSSKRLLTSALCLYLLVCFAPSKADAQQKQFSTAIVCPANIEIDESALPIPGWSTASAKQQRSFERISIFNGKVGGTEYDLAPDDQKEQGNRITQTWILKEYRTMNIFLRCRYRDTSVVLYKDLPPGIETCSLRFSIDRNGAIIGRSDMACR